MDRSSIRSFRAQAVAEHGLRELARSRLDTTRAVVFQGLGTRFHEARDDVVKVTSLFREDAFRASDGHFCRMDLRLDRAIAERLASIEPRAVEAKVEETTRAFLRRELPGAQGVYLSRFEPTSRGDLAPAARVHLSCRLANGAPTPSLTREDASRLHDAWARDIEKAFGLERGQTQERQKDPQRDSILAPQWERLREAWARAQTRVFAVYVERLGGKATHQELSDALAQARSSRAALSGRSIRPAGLQDLDRRQFMDVIQLRIEGGSRYLGGPLEGQRRNIIEVAASRAAGLQDGTERRPSAVVWPAGSDLQAALYFNQRARPERSPDSLDAKQLRDSLEARLGEQIRSYSASLEPTARERAEELGRVHAHLREPGSEREAPMERTQEAGLAAGTKPPAVVVVVDQAREEQEPTATARAQKDEIEERTQPKERDWGNERVFAVRVRIPTGADQLERLGLSAEEAAHVIQRAVERAYPFLAREGVRDNFIYAAQERALDVRIVVPEKLGWRAADLRSPQFQQRFVAGFHHALAQIAPTRLARQKEPRLAGIERALGIAQAPLILRRLEQEPERAAKQALGAVFDKLTRVLPQPFRIMREVGRTVGRFGRTE